MQFCFEHIFCSGKWLPLWSYSLWDWYIHILYKTEKVKEIEIVRLALNRLSLFWFYVILILVGYLMPIPVYVYILYCYDQQNKHICTQDHNNDTIKTSDTVLWKNTPLTLFERVRNGYSKVLLRQRWVGGWTELQYVDPNSYGHNSVSFWRCPWCNVYHRRKWTRWLEFKSQTRLIAFHIALIP